LPVADGRIQWDKVEAGSRFQISGEYNPDYYAKPQF
jgi:hypothetical protein